MEVNGTCQYEVGYSVIVMNSCGTDMELPELTLEILHVRRKHTSLRLL